jgi:lipopolysaccharide transport system ATP-binding protein
MKPILDIQNISKRFQIQHQGLPYLSFRDKITGLFKATEKKEAFWALKDVSFAIAPGESFGIIGRNGAGKSTLLKILSRITPPTSGRIVSRGRIASLLEVGTGFHQELSGRENIYMNGSILGMKKEEIDLRFDEMVEFSGVEKFLDTALKHYSSGMQLRLAFAVAAHLEPEILIIDEVLAVGDAEFQRKCLRKMEAVTGQGRTVIFVSHNMDAINSFCTKGIFLDKGSIGMSGSIVEVVKKYYETLNQNAITYENEIVKSIEIKEVANGLVLNVRFQGDQLISFPNLGFAIADLYGHPITGTNPMKARTDVGAFKNSKSGAIEVTINSPKLAQGSYQLMVWFGDGTRNFFETKDPLVFSINQMTNELNRNPKLDGYVVPECHWEFM